MIFLFSFFLCPAQDFTFSNQISGRPIGVAEAGDCCSNPECIQGKFKLNITGSHLFISNQQWVPRFHQSVKIVIEKVGRLGRGKGREKRHDGNERKFFF